MDITDIILDQHARQRKAFAQIEQWPADDIEGLTAFWDRLVIFLETHAEGEERYWYPHLLRLGTGANDADDGTVEGEVIDDIGDHNNIRDAIAKAAKEEVGTEKWWDAVNEANVQNAKHMAEEERQDLTDFRRHASLELRHQIAHEFLRFEALRGTHGIDAKNKDPEQFVEDPHGSIQAS